MATLHILNQIRKDLDIPRITSSTQTSKDLDRVYIKGNEDLDIISHGLAFRVSKAGLRKLGTTNNLEDPHFDQGSLVNEKKQLGDMAEYDKVFATDDYNDGVVLITSGSKLDFAVLSGRTC